MAKMIVIHFSNFFRFSTSLLSVDEPDGDSPSKHSLTVFRGLPADGLGRVGPDEGVVRIGFSFKGVVGGASKGSDFDAVDGVLEFQSGENKKEIHFFVNPDDEPEVRRFRRKM